MSYYVDQVYSDMVFENHLRVISEAKKRGFRGIKNFNTLKKFATTNLDTGEIDPDKIERIDEWFTSNFIEDEIDEGEKL